MKGGYYYYHDDGDGSKWLLLLLIAVVMVDKCPFLNQGVVVVVVVDREGEPRGR